eukprot:COSAG03_NODE_17797_length_367_cov_38.600746_2_plen_27_part_01
MPRKKLSYASEKFSGARLLVAWTRSHA